MKKIDLNGVTADTIARMIFLLVSMINGAAAIFGFTKLDIDENTIYTVVTGVSVIVSAVIGFWKNNSFTSAAIEGDNLKNALKNKDITIEDLKAVEEEEEVEIDDFLSEEEIEEMDME